MIEKFTEPNDETIKIMKEAEAGRVITIGSVNELFDSVLEDQIRYTSKS